MRHALRGAFAVARHDHACRFAPYVVNRGVSALRRLGLGLGTARRVALLSMLWGEGVAEPHSNKVLRIEYFEAISEKSDFSDILDSQSTKIGLRPVNMRKIGPFRPIFSCFCTVSGY